MWELVQNYGIGECIGKGSFGVVHIGIHLISGQKVAVKKIDKKLIKSNQDIILIKRELFILKKVKHCNIA